MPNPGYANFTIKLSTAKKLEEISRKNGVSLVSFINAIGEKIDPDVNLEVLLRALELAPSLNFSQFLESEVLKLRCANLYYHLKALISIASSLLQPSMIIDLRVITVFKIWEKKRDQLSAFQSAGFIDPSVGYTDVINLIQKLENGEKVLERFLNKTWHNWKIEFKEPLLQNDLRIPDDLLEIGMSLETLKSELKPYVENIFKLWNEANNLFLSLSSKHPELMEVLMDGLKEFAKLFLNFEPLNK